MGDTVHDKISAFERILKERKKLVFYGVKNVGLFGSFVRGDQKPGSDIDVLVEFIPEKHTFDNFMEVAFLLEKVLERKVDLITPEALSPHIGPHILKEVERVHIAA
jgi:predicted nucleotidyltransferase